MRNVRMDMQYDGTAYNGWQIQPGKQTIEAEVRAALTSLLGGERVSMIVAGRTDTGVHARQQVLNFHTRSTLSPNCILSGMNALLPMDISIKSVRDVPESFHARFDAVERHYRYRLLLGNPRLALLRHFVTHIHYPLDVDAMKHAAAHFVGRHDFSAFRSIHCGANNPVRDVIGATVTVRGRLLDVDLIANAFLRNMVRVIVGTLLKVGRGKMSPKQVSEILKGRDRTVAGPTAPPQGLTLWSVKYRKNATVRALSSAE